MELVTNTVLWRLVNVTPSQIDKPILYCTANNKLGVFSKTSCMKRGELHSHWISLSIKYNIKYWCYQEEIIPKI